MYLFHNHLGKTLSTAIHLMLIAAISSVISATSVFSSNTAPPAPLQNSTEIVISSPMDIELAQEANALTRFNNLTSIQDDNPEQTKDTISNILGKIKNLEQDYLDKLQKRRSSYGIYAIGEFDNDFYNSETRYIAGLKWKLFNDGYFEAVRNDAKKILQTQLEFYQLRRDMIERQLEDDLFQLFAFENLLNIRYYQEKEKALSSLLKKRTNQLKHGYTTELDVLDIRRQLKSSRNSLSFYQKSNYSEFTQEQTDLLDHLESVHLKKLPDLVDLTKTNSFNLKIQDTFIERAEFFPAWIDDISVNIDAEYKHEYYEKDRSVIGVELEIPLTFDTKRDSLIDTQKRVYKYQKQAINYRLHQRLEKLCAFFRFQKHRLFTQQEDIEILIMKTRKAASKEANIIQQLDTDPDRNLDLLSINMIDSRYEALRTRLKIYEIILKIMALTQAETVTSLFEFD